jgi:hypothetical protein
MDQGIMFLDIEIQPKKKDKYKKTQQDPNFCSIPTY